MIDIYIDDKRIGKVERVTAEGVSAVATPFLEPPRKTSVSVDFTGRMTNRQRQHFKSIRLGDTEYQ